MKQSKLKQEKGLPPILKSKTRVNPVGDLSVSNKQPHLHSSLSHNALWFNESKMVVIQPPQRDHQQLKSNSDLKQVLQFWS